LSDKEEWAVALSKESPSNGPRQYSAIADARSRSENRSLTEPPPMAIGALPEKPAGIISCIKDQGIEWART